MKGRISLSNDDERKHFLCTKPVSGSIMKDIAPQGIINGVDIMSLWGLVGFPNSPDKNRIMFSVHLVFNQPAVKPAGLDRFFP